MERGCRAALYQEKGRMGKGRTQDRDAPATQKKIFVRRSVSLAGRTALSCGQESVPATPLHGCRSAGTLFRKTTGFSGKGR